MRTDKSLNLSLYRKASQIYQTLYLINNAQNSSDLHRAISHENGTTIQQLQEGCESALYTVACRPDYQAYPSYYWSIIPHHPRVQQ